MQIVLWVFVAAFVAVNAAVTALVTRSKLYDRTQKRYQTAMIWLLPVLGAAVCFFVLQDTYSPVKPKDAPSRQTNITHIG